MSLKTLIVNNLRYFSINFDPSESWERGKERELKREKERREKRGGCVKVRLVSRFSSHAPAKRW